MYERHNYKPIITIKQYYYNVTFGNMNTVVMSDIYELLTRWRHNYGIIFTIDVYLIFSSKTISKITPL